MFGTSYTTVSYTHLDVYKRQISHRLTQSDSVSESSKKITELANNLERKIDLFEENTKSYIGSTELDLKKIQQSHLDFEELMESELKQAQSAIDKSIQTRTKTFTSTILGDIKCILSFIYKIIFKNRLFGF